MKILIICVLILTIWVALMVDGLRTNLLVMFASIFGAIGAWNQDLKMLFLAVLCVIAGSLINISAFMQKKIEGDKKKDDNS